MRQTTRASIVAARSGLILRGWGVATFRRPAIGCYFFVRRNVIATGSKQKSDLPLAQQIAYPGVGFGRNKKFNEKFTLVWNLKIPKLFKFSNNDQIPKSSTLNYSTN